MSDVSKLRILYVLEPDGIREATNEECLERARWRKDADPKAIPFLNFVLLSVGDNHAVNAAIVQALWNLASEYGSQDPNYVAPTAGIDIAESIWGRMNDVRTAMAPK